MEWIRLAHVLVLAGYCEHGNYPYEAQACLNIILEISPYLKENTTLHHYKDQLVNDV
jgi:hypothetical protein